MNLRKKVFLAFTAFIIVPLLVLGAITYMVSQHIIADNFADQSEFTLKAVGRNLTYVLKEANRATEQAMFEDEVQNALSAREQVDWIDRTEVGRLLQRKFLSYTPAYSASLYNFRGQAYSEGKIGYRALSYEALIEHPLYAEAIALNGVPRWLGPHENEALTGGVGLFTMIRVVNDKYTQMNKGVLLEQFQFNELHKIFNYFGTSQRKDIRFMIVNRDGLIMVDNKQQLDGRMLFPELMKPLDLALEYQSEKVDFDGVDSVVSLYHLELQDAGKMDWTLVSVTPWAYLSGTTELVLKWVGAIMTLCLICALLFNLLFVNRNIRFILRVVQSMKRVEMGDLSIREKMDAKDETGVLARGFNSLVERTSALLDEVKTEQERKNKAELMLLQAQIKPHFLFNTLESINALAAQNEGKKVSAIVRRLGTVLRISFHHREQIPLTLEADHLRSYLDIQKYRFEDVFDFEIDVPESLAANPVLKLTLQPLVENSIQHGFEGIERKGMIRVRAEETNEAIVIWVEDNGVGIPEERLARFRYRVGSTWEVKLSGGREGGQAEVARDKVESVESGESVGIERVGLGLSNVADRIRIQYGSRYGLYVCSWRGEDSGTLIRLVIPRQRADAGSERIHD
ncbi:sensor histidine kinase [Paenibacillus sp. HJGM_3]|uniref:cache domain-containing sensor histidine kinase n=1 Tax=Paenibacillus sp. HJGM_3 TaxID=3379816 RepID=UPI0038583FBD